MRVEKSKMVMAGALLLAVAASADIGSYVITGYADDQAIAGQGGAITGGNGIIPVGSSLDSSHVMGGNTDDYVDFMVGLEGQQGDVARLRVTVTGMTGSQDIMLARTENSQGLEDPGTISFGVDGDTVNSATLRFDWYQPVGDDPFVNQFMITSYDLDYNQSVAMPTAQVDEYYLTTDTDITYLEENGRSTFYAGNTSASYSDANAAFVMETPLGFSQEFTLGKTSGGGDLLFMFEFRNPPAGLGGDLIPEPTVALMMGVAGIASFAVRRIFMI